MQKKTVNNKPIRDDNMWAKYVRKEISDKEMEDWLNDPTPMVF